MPTGLESYSDIAAALGTKFRPQLFEQFNRSATALSLIRAVVARSKVPSWDVEFTDGPDAAAFAEGSDVAAGEYGTDQPVPATLGWAKYRAPFMLSDSEIKQAMRGIGSPEELEDILGHRMLGRAGRLASLANRDLFTGDGTDGSGNPTIVGFYGGALAATGTYATIARGTYAEWAGGVLANGGTPRALTIDLMNQAEELIYRACGMPVDFVMGSTGIFRKYKGLFENQRRLVTPGPSSQTFQAGATNLQFEDALVRRDKDASAGKLIMGVQDFLEVQFLPPLGETRDTVQSKMAQLQGSTGGPNPRITATAIPYEITPLAKTGNNVKFNLSLELQLCVLRCNAFVVIEDISES